MLHFVFSVHEVGNWKCCLSEALQKAHEYQKRKKKTHSRKQTDEFDKSSVNSQMGASCVNAKVWALRERQKRKMEEQEIEMQLWKKEV